MFENAFSSIIEGNEITIGTFLICSAASIVLGLISAFVCTFRSGKTKSMFTSIALLPLIVQVVIMIVNGNIGVGLAIAGAFSLVRFRSNPGTAADILIIFFTMTIGLVTGMGYVWLACVFTVAVLAVYFVLSRFGFSGSKLYGKELKVTIPESLNYSHIFDDIFEKYTTGCELVKVKTTNMGSMYQLSYHLNLKDAELEKEMIDEIRCRNGNLDIVCGMTPEEADIKLL